MPRRSKSPSASPFTPKTRRPQTEERPRHQGAGSLLRRNSADDEQRHVHHQRHRARHRSASCTVRPACSSSALRRRAISSARSFPIAEAGSNSNTTTRTCCTSVSTASANFTARCFCARSASKTDEQILRTFYRVSKINIKDNKLLWNVDEGLIGLKLSHAINSKGGETVVGAGPENHRQPDARKSRRPRSTQRGSGGQRSRRRLHRRRRGRHVDRRSDDRRQSAN